MQEKQPAKDNATPSKVKAAEYLESAEVLFHMVAAHETTAFPVYSDFLSGCSIDEIHARFTRLAKQSLARRHDAVMGYCIDIGLPNDISIKEAVSVVQLAMQEFQAGSLPAVCVLHKYAHDGSMRLAQHLHLFYALYPYAERANPREKKMREDYLSGRIRARLIKYWESVGRVIIPKPPKYVRKLRKQRSKS